MNIKKARKIDYWIGIFLCFLLSGLSHIRKAVCFKKNKTKPVRKIVFIKLSELGAIILAYPLINCVRKEHPSAELFFVTFERNRGIFKLLGEIIPQENILGIRESPALFVLDTLTALSRLSKERIDIVFDLEFFSRFSTIFSYLSGGVKRIGFYGYTFEGLYRGNLLTHKIQFNPLSHITRNYLSLSQAVKQEEKNSPQLDEDINDLELIFPKHLPDEKIQKRMLSKLRDLGVDLEENKLFLINPGEGILSLREWPVSNFIVLSELILGNKDNYIGIIGTQGATRKASLILENVKNPRCFTLVNQTELDELLELFSVADILVSSDCGLAHLAMLTSIKEFVIFGPESPQVFGPLTENSYTVYSRWPCSPCLSVLNHRNSVCTDNQCLKCIKPEDVYNFILNNS
jgi:ADP-heptose:LPS heptosyltransferase